MSLLNVKRRNSYSNSPRAKVEILFVCYQLYANLSMLFNILCQLTRFVLGCFAGLGLEFFALALDGLVLQFIVSIAWCQFTFGTRWLLAFNGQLQNRTMNISHLQ